MDVALQVPLPVPDGANTPPCVMEPPVALQVTLLLNVPVPLTFATQVVVCEVLIEEGFAVTATPVTVGAGAVTLIAAAPETFV